MRLNVGGNHCSSCNRCVVSDFMPAEDCAVGFQRSVMTDYCFLIISMLWIMCPWSQVIDKNARRATEDVIFQCNTFVPLHIIMNSDTIADSYIIFQLTPSVFGNCASNGIGLSIYPAFLLSMFISLDVLVLIQIYHTDFYQGFHDRNF